MTPNMSTYRTFAEVFELHSVHRYRNNGTATCCICLQAEAHTIHAYEDHIRSASNQHKFWPIHTQRWNVEICGHCSGQKDAPAHKQTGDNTTVTAHPYKPEQPTDERSNMFNNPPFTVQQPPQPTIDEEARAIVYGDREQAYDIPSRNFRKLAHMWTGTILEKLKPDHVITARDVTLMLIQLKISRESFQPNRENRVDGIGYWLCEQRVVEEDEDAE